MKILDRVENDIGVLTIKGNIVAQTIGEIRNFMESYIENVELKGLILDFEDVEFVDSAGLGLLASIYKTSKMLNKKLALTRVNNRIMETFTLTNLINIFIVTEDVTSAIATLR